jgi:hypothetical protein
METTGDIARSRRSPTRGLSLLPHVADQRLHLSPPSAV